MSKKAKINTVIIKSETRELKEGICTYNLIMKESRRIASYGIPLYSVSVELSDEFGNITTAVTKDIFSDAGKAVVFFDKVVKSLATPTDLPYIAEDELVH